MTVTSGQSGPESSDSLDEIELFLAAYPPRIAQQAMALRQLVRKAVPTAVERLRPGWKLIGYDLPVTGRGTYFAWVWPEIEHVHLGFEVGTLMADPTGTLRGAHLKLKKVRYLTFEPGERIPARVVTAFIHEAARIAGMSRAERQLLVMSRSQGT